MLGIGESCQLGQVSYVRMNSAFLIPVCAEVLEHLKLVESKMTQCS